MSAKVTILRCTQANECGSIALQTPKGFYTRHMSISPRPENTPSIEECSAQVLKALESVLSIRTVIPDNAMTADTLGTEREGHGIVINNQGLVLTIGYIVTEATSVWLVDHTGNAVQGHVVAYDQQSGFGLLQPLGKLSLPPVAFGKSADLLPGQKMLLAGCGGVEHTQQVRVGAIDEFAGYWEYLIDAAIFTAPAHPFWSGAALIGEDGRLYGIGSLVLQTVDQDDSVRNANMIIPIDLLPPILDDLVLYGKRNSPARPWVGWFTQESDLGLIVLGLSDAGPADFAGLQRGDLILQVNNQSVGSLAELFRTVWSAGDAGVDITVTFERDGVQKSAVITTVDRNALLVSATIH